MFRGGRYTLESSDGDWSVVDTETGEVIVLGGVPLSDLPLDEAHDLADWLNEAIASTAAA
jgi:hypothetical protein